MILDTEAQHKQCAPRSGAAERSALPPSGRAIAWIAEALDGVGDTPTSSSASLCQHPRHIGTGDVWLA
jgi:hypothetical protein